MRRHDHIRADLLALGHAERTAMLLTSVIQHEPEATAAARGVVRILHAMCRGMSGYRRHQLADELATLAEQLRSSSVEELQ